MMIKAIVNFILEKLLINHIESWNFDKKKESIDNYDLNGQQAFFALLSVDPGYFDKQEVIKKADKALSHNFDLLGSGNFQFNDKMPWNSDFVSGYTWPEKYYKIINKYPVFTLKKNIDYKLPWELSRCQHLPVLGLAYSIMNEDKYAEDIVRQVENWIENNPYKRGINWFVSMEVAIRAINWIWTYQLIKNATVLTEDFNKTFLNCLYLHGRYISENLEENSRGNHLFADLIGLIYLGFFFDTEEAKSWEEKGYKRLYQEIDYQFKDGVHYEQSTNYHFLVTEFVASAILLAQANDLNVPDRILKQYEKILEFIMHYTRTDGTAPIVGDADDGRLYKTFVDDINDHRYLLNIGAILFNRADFKAAYSDFNPMSYLLLGDDGFKKFQSITPEETGAKSIAYPETGFFISRHKDIYLLIKAGTQQKPEMTAHLHNDIFSFVLSIGNKNILIDPGTYVYARDPAWRNKFRGTAYHNTVMIDGFEQNRFFKPIKFHPRLFGLKSYDTFTKILKWETTSDFDLFEAEHYGYKKLKDPVVHRRRIYFDKKEEQIEIADTFDCQREHKFEWFFHFAPMKLELDERNPPVIRTTGNGPNIEIALQNAPEGMECEVMESWFSLGYGIKEKSKTVVYGFSASGNEESSFLIRIDR